MAGSGKLIKPARLRGPTQSEQSGGGELNTRVRQLNTDSLAVTSPGMNGGPRGREEFSVLGDFQQVKSWAKNCVKDRPSARGSGSPAAATVQADSR
jgi:hypothetical protein